MVGATRPPSLLQSIQKRSSCQQFLLHSRIEFPGPIPADRVASDDAPAAIAMPVSSGRHLLANRNPGELGKFGKLPRCDDSRHAHEIHVLDGTARIGVYSRPGCGLLTTPESRRRPRVILLLEPASAPTRTSQVQWPATVRQITEPAATFIIHRGGGCTKENCP